MSLRVEIRRVAATRREFRRSQARDSSCQPQRTWGRWHAVGSPKELSLWVGSCMQERKRASCGCLGTGVPREGRHSSHAAELRGSANRLSAGFDLRCSVRSSASCVPALSSASTTILGQIRPPTTRPRYSDDVARAWRANGGVCDPFCRLP